MNVIFLGIDGVMNHWNHMKKSEKHKLQEFCPRSVDNLKQIIEECDARIVVSSAWRLGETVDSIKEWLFSHYDLEDDVIGITPSLSDIRGKEIQQYLEDPPHKITNFIILDDDKDMGELKNHLIRTSPKWGLTDGKCKKAIKMLKK